MFSIIVQIKCYISVNSVMINVTVCYPGVRVLDVVCFVGCSLFFLQGAWWSHCPAASPDDFGDSGQASPQGTKDIYSAQSGKEDVVQELCKEAKQEGTVQQKCLCVD